MGKVVWMIPTSEDNTLFAYGFNENAELIFRTTRNIKHLQTESIEIKDGKCYTSLYNFSVGFLDILPIVDIEVIRKKLKM